MFLKKHRRRCFDDVHQNAKHRAYDASNDVNGPPLGGGGKLDLPKMFTFIFYTFLRNLYVMSQNLQFIGNPPSPPMLNRCFAVFPLIRLSQGYVPTRLDEAFHRAEIPLRMKQNSPHFSKTDRKESKKLEWPNGNL